MRNDAARQEPKTSGLNKSRLQTRSGGMTCAGEPRRECFDRGTLSSPFSRCDVPGAAAWLGQRTTGRVVECSCRFEGGPSLLLSGRSFQRPVRIPISGANRLRFDAGSGSPDLRLGSSIQGSERPADRCLPDRHRACGHCSYRYDCSGRRRDGPEGWRDRLRG